MQKKTNAKSFPISNERQQPPSNDLCHWSMNRWFLCCGLQCGMFLPIMQQRFLLFLPNLNQTSGHILSGLVPLWICVSLPITYLYHSRSFVRKIWNLVVPIHSSERVTPFASVHTPMIICSETLFILVWISLITSTYVNVIGNVSSSNFWNEILHDLDK